ncbi:hypothetical protein MRX96_009681 [Rhipicephalus microplus]
MAASQAIRGCTMTMMARPTSSKRSRVVQPKASSVNAAAKEHARRRPGISASPLWGGRAEKLANSRQSRSSRHDRKPPYSGLRERRDKRTR